MKRRVTSASNLSYLIWYASDLGLIWDRHASRLSAGYGQHHLLRA
jgi:hypothetical protein